MRFLCLVILILVLAALLIFALQNKEDVTVQYLDQVVSCPLALLIGCVYLLGMVSGWTVVGFLKRSFRRVAVRQER